jgi:hypothetical protein
MLIIDGTIGADITLFLERITTDVPTIQLMNYAQWLTAHPAAPTAQGIIYMRVMPEIAYARIQKRAQSAEDSVSLEQITHAHQQQEDLFINKNNLLPELQKLPILVLNGNIDFTTDFAQFYNHLFYIKKFLKEIQDIHASFMFSISNGLLQ